MPTKLVPVLEPDFPRYRTKSAFVLTTHKRSDVIYEVFRKLRKPLVRLCQVEHVLASNSDRTARHHQRALLELAAVSNETNPSSADAAESIGLVVEGT